MVLDHGSELLTPEDCIAEYKAELQAKLDEKIQLTVERFKEWKQEDPAIRRPWSEVFEGYCEEIGWYNDKTNDKE